MQNAVLLSHFFRGLFESDLFAVRDRLTTIFAGIVSLLAAFGLILPLLFNQKYYALNALPTPALYQEAALADKLMYISISFVLTIVVTSLQWQSLFPSLHDFLILGPLPLHRRQIFGSKFLALLVFIALVIVAMNVLPAATMPGVMSGQWQLPHGSLMHIFSLFISCCGAGFFAFFALIALQALLMNLLPATWFSSCSLVLQALLQLLSVTALPLLLWIPNLHAYMRMPPPPWLAIPPFWFLGLEERMLGASNPLATMLALRAELGLGIAAASSLALYALVYARNSRQFFPASKQYGVGRFHSLLSYVLNAMVKSVHEAAIISFTIKTLMRSRVHKMLLCAIAGLSFAIAFDSFSSLWITHAASHSKLENAVLSKPLIISFFVICGLRFLFLLPVESRGNWTFRLSGIDTDDIAVNATEKALAALAIAPILLICFLAFWLWFGIAGSLERTAFVLLMCLVLEEALLWNWDRVPFACPYLPGKRNLIQSMLLYGLALSFFAYVSANIEMLALRTAWGTSIMFLILVAAFYFLRSSRRRSSNQGILLRFDDLPEPEFQTLQLRPD